MAYSEAIRGGVGGGGGKPYIGMCRCEGYGFQAVYSGIGYINHINQGIIFHLN